MIDQKNSMFANNKRRWPAEWEAHAATWMAFPCRKVIWKNGLEVAQQAFANVANVISEFEAVNMLINPEHLTVAKKILSSQVNLMETKLDDSWTRDTAPIWIKENEKNLALDFSFNAWGNKFSPYANDKKLASVIAEYSGTKIEHHEMILEGGAVHSNGAGVLMTTKECLLNSNRNPNLTQAEIEKNLKQALGVTAFIWLENGVSGDLDTDGHIDNIACFVDQKTIVSQKASEQSENFLIYQANRQIIEEQGYQLIEIEEPEARYFDGIREPLSYINFYLANDLVLVPKFRCKQDSRAASQLAELFPNRKVISLEANEILVGGGGIHCITMQQPVF